MSYATTVVFSSIVFALVAFLYLPSHFPSNLEKVCVLWSLEMKLIHNSHHGPAAIQDTKDGRPLSFSFKKFEDWLGKQTRIHNTK